MHKIQATVNDKNWHTTKTTAQNKNYTEYWTLHSQVSLLKEFEVPQKDILVDNFNYIMVSGPILLCVLHQHFNLVMQFQAPQHKYILLHSPVSNSICSHGFLFVTKVFHIPVWWQNWVPQLQDILWTVQYLMLLSSFFLVC